MKVLVDREKIEEAHQALIQSSPQYKTVIEMTNLKNIAIDILCKILNENPEHVIFEAKLDELRQLAEPDFYNARMELYNDVVDIQAIRKAVDKMNINKETLMFLADKRCDGCRYQHPHQSNIRIDEINNLVLCYRNLNASFLKDGEWVAFEPERLPMICEVYKWDMGLVKLEDKEESETVLLPNDITKLKSQLVKQEEAIIEILNMLIENEKTNLKATMINSDRQSCGFENELEK